MAVRLLPDPEVETPEALVLGLAPGEGQLRPGPLLVSAFGADPPERSTHFHLSLLQSVDGRASDSTLEVSDEELREVLEAAKKLNTKTLTLVAGEGRDHGLVWEGLGDMRTHGLQELAEKPVRQCLPEGDPEVMLRRYIDDSINLLSELELNVRRAGEELPLLNLLWPWGEGIRLRVPNLALRRGGPAWVVSESLRLQGLARLAGYIHVDRAPLRKGINLNLESVSRTILQRSPALVWIPTFTDLRKKGMLEEAEWFTRRVDDLILTSLADQFDLGAEPMRLTLVCGSTRGGGLGLEVVSGRVAENPRPFSRVLWIRRVFL